MSPFSKKNWHDEIEATDTPISAAALEEMEERLSTYTDSSVTTTSVRHGEGAPASELGLNGDFYIDTVAKKVYGPKTAGAWGSGESYIGPTGPTGATGTAGKTVLSGSGAPNGGTGSDGDFYLDTSAYKMYGPKTSGAWPGGVELKGAAGRNVGLKYTYSATVTEADPETGKIRLNNATLSSVTALFISETDGDGASTASWIQTWDDSTNSIKGYVTLTKDSDPSQYALYRVTEVLDKGTWDKVVLVYQTGHGSFVEGDNVRISFARSGDKGETGPSNVVVTGPTQISSSPGFMTGGNGFLTPGTWLFENLSGGTLKRIHLYGQVTSNASFNLGILGYKPLVKNKLIFPCMAFGLTYSGIPLSSAWLEVSLEGIVTISKPSGTIFSGESFIDLSGIYFFTT